MHEYKNRVVIILTDITTVLRDTVLEGIGICSLRNKYI